MDAQQYRRLLREGDPAIFHKDFKGVKWVEKEIKRIKKITDLEERQKEAEKIWWICSNVYGSFCNPPKGVNPNEPYGFNDFKKLYEEIKSLRNKSTAGSNHNKKKCSQCQESIISAWGVNQDCCSFKCCLQSSANNLLVNFHSYTNSLSSNLKPYAENLKNGLQEASNNINLLLSSPEKLQSIVENGTKLESYLSWEKWAIWKIVKYCLEKKIKELSSQQNSDDNFQCENNQSEYISCQECHREIKAGKSYYYHKTKNNYCSTCYQLVKQEQPEQEWNPTIYCRYCSTKTELFEVCDKKECLEKMNQEIENKKGGNSNTQERKNISFEQQLQSEITNLETNSNKTTEQQAELEEKKKRLQELEELLKKQNSNANNTAKPSDKTGLVIGCGVIIGVVLILSIFIIAKIRKKKTKKY